MAEKIYMTKEKIRSLEAELHDLKTRGRNEIAKKIAEARSHGDLSENADYDAAKDEQGLLELKISKISNMLANSEVISADEFPDDKVYILSRVKLKNHSAKSEIEYQIVSEEEADFMERKLSMKSPLGKALLGKEVGDKVEIKVPAGINVYEILEISK